MPFQCPGIVFPDHNNDAVKSGLSHLSLHELLGIPNSVIPPTTVCALPQIHPGASTFPDVSCALYWPFFLFYY